MNKGTINTIVGILLIFGILFGYMFLTQPSAKDLQERARLDSIKRQHAIDSIANIEKNSHKNIAAGKKDKAKKQEIKKSENETPEIYTASGYYLHGIVPGWGQFYTGHWSQGSFFSVAFVGSAAWTVIAHLKYIKSKNA